MEKNIRTCGHEHYTKAKYRPPGVIGPHEIIVIRPHESPFQERRFKKNPKPLP